MLRSYSYVDVHNNIKHQFWLLTCYPVPCRVHGCVFGGQGELSVSYLLEFRSKRPKALATIYKYSVIPSFFILSSEHFTCWNECYYGLPDSNHSHSLSLWLTVSSGPKRWANCTRLLSAVMWYMTSWDGESQNWIQLVSSGLLGASALLETW